MILRLSTCKIQHNFRNIQFSRKINSKNLWDCPFPLWIYS
ncbi:hypothetical protein HMPREF9441_00479 [Paraprevotella clara YIT 11840]|uniref:Uncharacterized protein n=1 Tax=Paraprevotella clara YIT 11840 TaxID=762968 RepID=G5SMA6_9BACT|nr:hypothetical protein HMPREF9441_00479 [Paraprevotella clara YIT 11840]